MTLRPEEVFVTIMDLLVLAPEIQEEVLPRSSHRGAVGPDAWCGVSAGKSSEG